MTGIWNQLRIYLGVISLISLVSTSGVGCGPKEDQTKKESFVRGDVFVEVETMLHAYQKAIHQNGLLAEFKFLDSSDDFFWIPPGSSRALTYPQVADVLNINAKRYTWIDNEWIQLDIRPLSRDIATYHGLIKTTMLDTSEMVTRYRLMESGTVIRRPGGWKILSGQTSIIEEEKLGAKSN